MIKLHELKPGDWIVNVNSKLEYKVLGVFDKLLVAQGPQRTDMSVTENRDFPIMSGSFRLWKKKSETRTLYIDVFRRGVGPDNYGFGKVWTTTSTRECDADGYVRYYERSNHKHIERIIREIEVDG